MSTEVESYQLVETRTYLVRTVYYSVYHYEVTDYITHLHKVFGDENILEVSSKRVDKTVSVLRCVYKTLQTEETSINKDIKAQEPS